MLWATVIELLEFTERKPRESQGGCVGWDAFDTFDPYVLHHR